MSLSKRVVETLIDLVEIKLSCIEVYDRDDKREIAGLERCRQELQGLLEVREKVRRGSRPPRLPRRHCPGADLAAPDGSARAR